MPLARQPDAAKKRQGSDILTDHRSMNHQMMMHLHYLQSTGRFMSRPDVHLPSCPPQALPAANPLQQPRARARGDHTFTVTQALHRVTRHSSETERDMGYEFSRMS